MTLRKKMIFYKEENGQLSFKDISKSPFDLCHDGYIYFST